MRVRRVLLHAYFIFVASIALFMLARFIIVYHYSNHEDNGKMLQPDLKSVKKEEVAPTEKLSSFMRKVIQPLDEVHHSNIVTLVSESTLVTYNQTLETVKALEDEDRIWFRGSRVSEQEESIHWTKLRDHELFKTELEERINLEGPEYIRKGHSLPSRFIIHTFSWKRYASFKRLVDSLLSAMYFGIEVEIVFNIDGNATSHILDFVKNFKWPHGPVTIRCMESRIGLEKMITTAWNPTTNDEFAFLFEDDIEVSPFYFQYTLLLMNRYVYGRQSDRESYQQSREENSDYLDGNLFGYSLYTPRWDEINNPTRYWIPSQKLPGNVLFLMQVPCSWGALYFPWAWRKFLSYYRWRTSVFEPELLATESASPFTIVPNSNSNRWTRSWKKHLIDLMFAKGYYLIYPNFPKQASLSTNHREPGAHTGKKGAEAEYLSFQLVTRKIWHYTVPLLDRNTIFSSAKFQAELKKSLSALPVVNIYHEIVESRTSLLEQSLDVFEGLRKKSFKKEKSGMPVADKEQLIKALHDDELNYRNGCVLDEISPLSEFISNRTEEEEYILFQPQMGYNNQLRAIEDAIALARILNRTLVLAPLRIIRPNLNTPLYLPLKLIFKIPKELDAYIKHIDALEFIEMVHKGQIEKPSRQVLIKDLTKFLQPNHEFVTEMGFLNITSKEGLKGSSAKPGDDEEENWDDEPYQSATGRNPIIKVPSLNRKSGSIWRLYGGCRDKVLSFTTLYNAFNGFNSDNKDNDTSEYDKVKASLWKLSPWLEEIVQASEQLLLNPGVKEPSEPPATKNYACFHIRRSDFKEYCRHLEEKFLLSKGDVAQKKPTDGESAWLKDFNLTNCHPDQKQVVGHLESIWRTHNWFPNNSSTENSANFSNIYISSDAPEDLLPTLQNSSVSKYFTFHTQLIIYRAFVRGSFIVPPVIPNSNNSQYNNHEHEEQTSTNSSSSSMQQPEFPLPPSLSYNLKVSDVLPFIEQEICMRAPFFIGNYYSTFSRRIVRARDSMGHPKEMSVFLGNVGRSW